MGSWAVSCCFGHFMFKCSMFRVLCLGKVFLAAVTAAVVSMPPFWACVVKRSPTPQQRQVAGLCSKIRVCWLVASLLPCKP